MNHLSEEQLILHYYGEEGRRPLAPNGTSTTAKSAVRSTAHCSACSTSWIRCPCRSAGRSTEPRCGAASSSVCRRGVAVYGVFPLPGDGPPPVQRSHPY
jgi:hypothetical protein